MMKNVHVTPDNKIVLPVVSTSQYPSMWSSVYFNEERQIKNYGAHKHSESSFESQEEQKSSLEQKARDMLQSLTLLWKIIQ
jgi:hypothetical protein